MKVFVVSAISYGDYEVMDVFAKCEDAAAAVKQYEAEEQRQRRSRRLPVYTWYVIAEHEVNGAV